MMDEDLVCSDFCEENGFAASAELLRALAGGGGKAYVVMERGAEYDDCIMEPKREGQPRTIFLDRAEAERAASERDARWHRENNILWHCYNIEEITGLPRPELGARISAILGIDLDPEASYWGADSLLTASASDRQAREFAALFTLKFHYVLETEFGPSDTAAGACAGEMGGS